MENEKVIKGLECCTNRGMECEEEKCPYWKNDDCLDDLEHDALAMLKKQDERIKELELEKGWDESPDMMGKW